MSFGMILGKHEYGKKVKMCYMDTDCTVSLYT